MDIYLIIRRTKFEVRDVQSFHENWDVQFIFAFQENFKLHQIILENNLITFMCTLAMKTLDF